MRVLVATTAGEGHFGPVVPFAIALRDAGHEVRVAAPESFEASVRRTGLDHVPVADAPPEVLGPIFSRLPSLSLEEANAVVFKEVFCGIDARSALPAMQAVADQWRPDLVLREVAEFSSLVVAERAGIPHAQVALSLNSVELTVRPLVDEPLRALGLDRGADSLATVPRLTLVPASFDDDAQTDGTAPHRFRYPLGTASRDPIPEEWWTNRADPLIYMTFGSVTASLGFYPELYRTMLKAAADLPVRVLLTLGEAADPLELEPLPTNAHVERWFPQEQVMPSAAAIVGHGGFGTTMLGLSAGVPMVAVPLFTTDQHANAHRVQSIGAGITVQLGPNIESDVREGLERIIQSGTHHAVARRIADDITALPNPAECVTLLEKIATRR
jgi:UDP:flavonoid glycosyltransferase YjiC (YdhE family)